MEIDIRKPAAKTSKGEILQHLLSQGEMIHRSMDALFLQHGINRADLRLLPPDDRRKWYRLKHEADGLTSEICNLING